jgi:hypothetical protein
MGYQVFNLPPRYVHQTKNHLGKQTKALHQCGKTTSQREGTRRRVHFNEDANQTIQVARLHNKQEIWYNHNDLIGFQHNWSQQNLEIMTPRKKKKHALLLGERSVPPLEDFQTFGSENRERRKKLVGTVVEHQASCKAVGYTDPYGYYIISKALSRNGRKFAWRAAAVNAYEVECFRKEMISVSMYSLFMDYYWNSIYPHLKNEPLMYLSKVLLCECD